MTKDNTSADALRRAALDLFLAGVDRAQPAQAVENALLQRKGDLAAAKRVFLLALGKAGVPMARAALPFLASKIADAVIVTNVENAMEVEGATVIAGGHPLPTEGSLAGANALEALALEAEAGDLVLVLVSGGGSALVCSPIEGLSLANKIALNDALIRSGADIREINMVRSAVSRLKGGGLARAAAPARVLALILSDVPGDDPAVIASGPTLWPAPSPNDLRNQAQTILQQHGLLEALPPALRDALAASPLPAPAGEATVENILIGSNRLSVDAMEDAASDDEWTVLRIEDWLDGDVGDAALHLHRLASTSDAEAVAILAGGETTVHVTGGGRGGRNQDLALRFALLAEATPLHRPWVFLSGGTDGRDGPTDAAGGLVDAGTLDRIRAGGLDPQALLADNDSYRALEAGGDLLKIGSTGTNVADLQVILLGPKTNAAG